MAELTLTPIGSPEASETAQAQEATADLERHAEIVEKGVPETDSEFLSIGTKIVYHLSEFDGPLDLLLELIKDAKINIEDIFISDVTHQYVEIIKNTPKEELDFEYAGEFITLAAELVYIKSLRTLPKEEDEDCYDDAEAEEQALINKVREYALMQQQSLKLKELETINRFCRQPVFSERDYRVSLTNFSLPRLVDAFARVLLNSERKGHEDIPKKVIRERFSVPDQMQRITQLLASTGSMLFDELFEADYDRSDVITTFLAVLELLKYGRLTAVQEDLFGQITIYAVEGLTDKPIDFEEGDNGEY